MLSTPNDQEESVFLTSAGLLVRNISPDQSVNLCADLRQLLCRRFAFPFRFSGTPVDALDLVGEHDARHGCRDAGFKGIVLDLCCHWTAQHQARFPVVAGRTQDQGGPMAGLLSSCLRSEL